jgi:hypothetical protein
MTFRTGRWTTRLWIAATSAVLALWAAPSPAADSTALIRKARKEVIEASIKAPTDPKAGSAGLRRSVDAVDGIRLEPKVEPPPPMPELTARLPVIEPMPVMPLMPATENNPAGGAMISEAVVERLKNLAPDKVADPLGLADALYLGGRLAEASTFYERVLMGVGAGAGAGAGAGGGSSDTKAWALYQMANCRRSSDPAAAVAFYKRVAAEYPKSPWAGVSAVQQRLLEWYQTVGPTTSPGAKKEAAEPAAAADTKNPVVTPAASADIKNPTATPAAVTEAKKTSNGH